MFCRNIEQALYDLGESRKQRRLNLQRMDDYGFQEIQQGRQKLLLDGVDDADKFCSFDFTRNPCFLRIFLKIVDEEVVQTVMKSISPEDLILENKPGRDIVLFPGMIYEVLAFTIRIIGLQNRPLWNRKNSRPLREAVEEASTHFQEKFPNWAPLGVKKVLRLIACAFISKEMYAMLSTKFQNIVTNVGEYVSGDEKLFHFTGNSGDIRLVPSKPDRVGLWFYEMCMPLRNGKSYLLYMKLHSTDKAYGETIPVMTIVQDWANIVKSKGKPNTLLVFDSYYLDGAGRKHLHDENVKYVGAITKERFGALFDKVKDKIQRPGDWYGLHNPQSKESVVYCWDQDINIGKKLVISNAMKLTDSLRSSMIVPIIDLYKITFKACDVYNKNLHDRTWPHRHGGRKRSGDFGLIHNFALSCILQNVFNSYCEICDIDMSTLDFETFCIELSDSIYESSRL